MATPAASPALAVTIEGDEIGPNAKRIKLGRDEELTIQVTSDRAGQLHVHSKPDQYVDFSQGVSTSTITISTPGVVDIEEHDTSTVVAQVEVR